MMERLAKSDPTELVEGPPGTERWTPDDAYAQAHSNKPEYAGHVRGVSKNILPMRGYIHLYYTLSQARSQNAPPSAVISEMIEKALEVKDEQHKLEMEKRLAQQRVEHRQQMDAMSAAITEQFAAQMAAHEARFHSLEGSTVVISEPEVTTEKAVHNLGSSARHIVRLSTNSTQGNN
jgi:hypothetical protein